MTKFHPLYIRRSDGKLEVPAKGKRTEINRPTDEQLDQKPDKNGVSDFYREVGMEEPKHVDWRRKLGGMLARELDWKDKNSQSVAGAGYMLVTFPEHYRLYEHVKKTEKDGKTEVKSKTHAAGGNDRQDAYLYGHPAGRKKRYRSPGDFFPHLLWLCTDESGDPDNCSCKICTPEDLDELMPGAKAKAVQSTSAEPMKTEPGAAANVMARQGSGQSMAKVKQEPQPATPAQPPQLSPNALPQPNTHDQRIDQTYNTFLYRPGELVWFSRGQAWGLGAVLRRWRQGSNQNHYSVQPLSHPFSHPRAVVKISDSQLRPWLAWSVPSYTNEALNDVSECPGYATIDWSGMMQKKYGNGDAEVDASILSAKTVDCSYTLFSKTRSVHVDQVNETFYDGMFLGAEKIWIGDPVRLQPHQDVMVLQSIVERTAAAAEEHAVYLIGDIYQLQQVRHTNPMAPTPAAAASNPHLPPRLTSDLTFRNERSITAKGIASYWKLIRLSARVDLNQIKGRWYEASLILPILQENEFPEAARKGEIAEATLWMNSRGDSINANRAATLPRWPRQNIYRATRRQAFGPSMPPNAEIKEGIEPPSAVPENLDPALDGIGASQSSQSMDIDPRFDTADTNNVSDEIHVAQRVPIDDRLNGGGGLDELMNLDGMDEHGHGDISGFGQQYGQEGGHQRYY